MKAQSAKALSKPTPAQLADELGALEKEYNAALAPFEMKVPRIKALKAALQEACPAKPDQEWTVEGARFGVTLGPCAEERTIDIKTLVKHISAAAFAKFATCTLKALERHVAPETFDQVVTIARTGPRKLSTFEKGA